VVTDSTAALPDGVAARWGLAVVPLDVVVDGRRHLGGADLPPAALVEALRRGAKVSTSQPAPEAFSRVYARLAAEGATAVVSVHLSGELSGTVASARSAAERAQLPVHVVDSRSAAMGLGFAALAAAWTAAGVPDELRLVAGPGPSAARQRPWGQPHRSGSGAAAGGPPSSDASGGGPPSSGATGTGSSSPRAWGVGRSSPGASSGGSSWSRSSSARSSGRRLPDLAADLRRLPERAAGLLRHPEPPGPDEVADAARAAASAARVWFLVDSLEHLRRGGRLSAPAAALGTVLGLRPLLTIADGRVVVGEKIRTRRAARERLEAVAVAAATVCPGARLAVHHLGQPDVAAELAARLSDELGDAAREVVVAQADAVLGAHVGPGLLAVVVAPA
jgi:fatty acid-binding protein DegV